MQCKRLARFVILALIIALVAPLAVSAGGGQVQVQTSRKDFACVGIVDQVYADALLITPATGFGLSGQVMIYVTTDTQFSPAGTSLSTIVAGDEIRASGRVVDGRLVAEVIVVAP